MCVLVIDDNAELRSLLVDTIEFELDDFETLEAESGDEGLELVRDNADKIKLIICDYMLPNYSGHIFYKSFKEQFNIDMPFIFISGSEASKEIAELVERNENILFFEKPCDMSKLFEEVRRLIK